MLKKYYEFSTEREAVKCYVGLSGYIESYPKPLKLRLGLYCVVALVEEDRLVLGDSVYTYIVSTHIAIPHDDSHFEEGYNARV